MPKPGSTIVCGTMSLDDHRRLKVFVGTRQSLNDYVRGLISADLEEAGEAPLSVSPRTPRPRGLSPITHGTVSGYTSHRCRCDLCRGARHAYYQKWKAAGACATL